MNAILIIIDTLRQDYVGCYGNDWIQTPNLDAFARESVVYTRAYPDSLPTLQVRRALQTGCRVYPFWGHKYQKGDFVGAPGWGPVSEEKDTIAEILQRSGYRTAFITDTYHQFKPSKNFHRGFDEWVWIRGQETDPFRSGPVVSDEVVMRHIPEKLRIRTGMVSLLRRYYTNVADRHSERDYFPAQVFSTAGEWLERNQDADKFFLVVDSFDPHETWDPPVHYRKLYDSNEDVVDVVQSLYGRANQLTKDELRRLRANYAGEVTLVDHWLGVFLDTVRRLGLMNETLIAIISDHGYCLCEHGLVSKQGHPMTREIADLVFMIRHPQGFGAGTVCDHLVYNFDLPATILARLGIQLQQPMEGQDVWPSAIGGAEEKREHITVGWGPFIMVRNEDYWYNAYLWGKAALLYDLKADPRLQNNIARERPDVCKEMAELAIEDAGGKYPDYLKELEGKPGCTPMLAV